MARIDYFALEEELQQILLADPEIGQARVDVEDEVLLGAETCPWVGIYLDRRDAPTSLQPIAAGTRTRYLVRFSVWCWQFSLEGITKAIKLRDDLLGKTEVALMNNRTLNNLVTTSWLEGGDMPSARLPGEASGWLSGGEIILVADVTAST